MTSAIAVDHLAKSFGSVAALREITFDVPTGAVTALLGPNGAGKSTTLRICEGYLTAGSGSVSVLGRDPQRQAADLRPRVGVLLQSGGLPPGIRATEAVHFAASLYANPLPPSEVIETFGLAALGRTPFRRLSGGEQRRVALALALIGRPELVILDEPTSGMDPQARRLVWDVVASLRSAGVSVLLSTHLMDEAAELADHVVIIDRGQVVAAGSPRDLTAQEREQLTFRASAHLPLDSLLRALPAGMTAQEPAPGAYVVAGPITPETLASVTAFCAANGAMARDIVTGTKSLEDVFFELTGRELRS